MESTPGFLDVIPLQWASVIDAIERLVPEDHYAHWTELAKQRNPYGISHEAWWAALKICRLGQIRSIGFEGDEPGAGLCFATPGDAVEMLHRLDQIRPEEEVGPENIERIAARALVMEAVGSARLAGSVTTFEAGKELLRAGRSAREGDEQMILNTHRALQYVRDQTTRPLAPGMLSELHRRMTQGIAAAGEDGDLFRTDATGRPESAARAASTPPETGPQDRLEAMCAFANGQTPEFFVHPVIRGIILHFWLVRDHPFSAANGRTARALFCWAMQRQGYSLFEFISLSPILGSARENYRRSFLESVTDNNDLTYFILAQLRAIAAATQVWRDDRVRNKDELKEAARRLQGFGNLNGRQQTLLAHAFRHPDAAYVIAGHQRSHGVTHQTARDDLFDLVGRELLTVTRERRIYTFRPVAGLAGRIQSAGGRRRGGSKAGVAAETLPTTLL